MCVLQRSGFRRRRGFLMSKNQIKISHTDLCIATAKRFNEKIALYEYKSFVSNEEPDVLVFCYNHTMLFEIKTSISDFKKDQHKEARKKYTTQYWARHLPLKEPDSEGNNYSSLLKLDKGHVEIVYVEKAHLGNKRYYVCPWGLIPIELVPEGWGLYYYKNGKFFLKKESNRFRSNYRKEIDLVIHSMRRYASGDSTGILINTYGGEKENDNR